MRKSMLWSALALVLAAGPIALAQDTTNYPILGRIHREDPRLD